MTTGPIKHMHETPTLTLADDSPTVSRSFDKSTIAKLHEELNRVCQGRLLTAREVNERTAEILMRAARELRKVKPE